MASKNLNNFRRKPATRRCKRCYFLVCEGSVTEPAYFTLLNTFYDHALINLKCYSKQNSAPNHLLSEANKVKKSKRFENKDEVWIIQDLDNWSQEQLVQLSMWHHPEKGQYLAVSNPCFELWLMFHDQNPNTCSKAVCQNYFKENIAHGDKGIRKGWLNAEKIKNAVVQAKGRDHSQELIPSTPGSKVFLLIEHLEDFCKRNQV